MRNPLIHSTVLAALLGCSALALAATAPPAPNASSGAAATQQKPYRMHQGMHEGMHQGMHEGMRQGMHHGMHEMGLLRQLDLTDTQRASVHQLMQQSFEQAHSGMQALHEKRMAFEKAVPGSAGYQAAANELAEAESSAAHARVLREADLRAKIHDLLTPAQRTQLANLREQRETKMKQWRESRMQKRSMQAPAAASTAD